MKSDLVFKVENVSKKFSSNDGSEFWALKNINFELKKGDVLGIIGSNGSGKSTLLKIISGNTKPTSGSVEIYENITSILDIGFGCHPDLSGRENIYLFGSIMLGMNRNQIDNVISKIINFSELDKFIDEPVKNYSAGMYLRLAISIVFFCNHNSILLDEVFAVGDNAFKWKCYKEINNLIKNKTSIIIASHNLDEVMRICNKCLLLQDGNVIMLGNVQEVIAKYNSLLIDKIKSKPDYQDTALIAQCKWDSEISKNYPFILKSVQIKNEGSEVPHAEIAYEKDILIEIDFIKNKREIELAFTFTITDENNSPLLVLAHYDQDKSNKLVFDEIGEYRYTCKLNKKLLTIGIYKLQIQVFMNRQLPILLNLKDTLMFAIVTDDITLRDFLYDVPINLVSFTSWKSEKFKIPIS